MQIFLETDRLVLRRFTPADVDHLFQLENDPEVMRYLNGGRPVTRAVIQQERLPEYLRYYGRYEGFGYWAAQEKATGAFLGWFHLWPLQGRDPGDVELGYRLRRSAWGKGYATEGARALIDKGFRELGVQRVLAFTMAMNGGSRRVMEKAGLHLVRLFHQTWPDVIEGAEHGDVEYALSRSDWQGKNRLT